MQKQEFEKFLIKNMDEHLRQHPAPLRVAREGLRVIFVLVY